jgi:tight adherence protein C
MEQAAVLGGIAVFIVAALSLSMRLPPDNRPKPKEKNLLSLLAPALRMISLVTRGLVGPRYRGWARQKLDAAGLSAYVTVEEFFALRFVLLAVVWFATMPHGLSLRIVLLLFATVYPELWVKGAITKRHADIRSALPYFTDLLAMCTGAGLDFGTATERVIERAGKGALVDELTYARRDVALGMSQHDALMAMSARIQMPEMTSFVAILVQAIRMGVTVSEILEAQAGKMRMERYERAERAGTVAQQKILIPLILLILPAFFLLGLMPVIYAMLRPMLEGGLFGG